MKHELEELAKLTAERCGVDITMTRWTEHGLLVIVRANGLVPQFCGETLERELPPAKNIELLTACAERAKEAAARSGTLCR